MIVELSHRIVEGMITYPGIPGPRLGDHLSREASREVYAPGTEFHIGTIALAANTGTYLDTPFHRYPDGPDLSRCRASRLADLPGLVVRAEGAARGDGSARTGRTRPGRTHPDRLGPPLRHREVLRRAPLPRPPEAAAWLVEQGAALVGIDSLNIDDTPRRGERPGAHAAARRRASPWWST